MARTEVTVGTEVQRIFLEFILGCSTDLWRDTVENQLTPLTYI
jgi:hypothetical protein